MSLSSSSAGSPGYPSFGYTTSTSTETDPYAKYTTAMTETQKRAAADRLKALQAIKDAMAGGGGSTYSNLVQKLAESPETITPEMESQMYEKARVPVEAQTQAALRNIQEKYYSRGVPGGAMSDEINQLQIGKAGNLGNLKYQLALKRAELGKSDLLNAIGAAGNLASYQMGGAQNLANIYSNTIADVPYSGPTQEPTLDNPYGKGYEGIDAYRRALKEWQDRKKSLESYNAG